MHLYHGSYTNFANVELNNSRRYKDFGQGFYTTEYQEQAEKWARAMTDRNNISQGIVSVYEVDRKSFSKYNSLLLATPTEEWAYFIMNNRNRNYRYFDAALQNHNLQYDIVERPVANDNIAVVLDQFMMNMKSGAALVEALEY